MFEDEILVLNDTYRKRKSSTNILSFNYSNDNLYSGDLAICYPIIKKEANYFKKKLIAHLSHITVHGFLHIKGYDHEKEKDALKMEKVEIRILQRIGIDNPYI